MILAGALLHWLASQSIFVVSVEWWANVSRTVPESTEMEVGEWGRDDWHDFATCGYSPLALFIFIIFAAVFLVVMVGVGRRWLEEGIPVVGSCSLGIAAACHVDTGEERLFREGLLKWGSVEQLEEDGSVVKRCGFSIGEVGWPVEGEVYG
jgi:hypothetical protein